MDAHIAIFAAVDAAADSARKLTSFDERYNLRETVEGGARAFDAQLAHAFDRFVDDVRELTRAATTGDEATHTELFRRRHANLCFIERTLAMRASDFPRLARRALSDERRRRLRSMYDTVLTNTLDYARSMQAVNDAVTRCFNDLCRGITTFNTDDTPSRGPTYHRARSCGPRDGGQDFKRNNMDCVAAAAGDKERRAEITRTCYVERLVYDRLYTSILGHDQNMPHRHELRHVERLFQECFPGKAIEVAVSFTGDVATVSIATRNDAGIERLETYNKIDKRVVCDFVEYSRDGRVRREGRKVQSADRPAEWTVAD